MPKRQVFYSFHYKKDFWRASTVRSMGIIDGNRPATDNDWETIKSGMDEAIKRWIKEQMEGRTCTIVLVGEETANRRWINHEIVESWNSGMGVAGIYIHGLKDQGGNISNKGENPFDHITHNPTKSNLSTIVKCYDPPGNDSKEIYAWINKYLAAIVEEAITIRGQH